MYDSVNCKINTPHLQPMYSRGNDKSDYIRQQTWYINEFLGSHKDYSDVNEMSEVLERLTFINPSFVRKEMLQVAIKKMFERFRIFIYNFDIEHLMSLLKLIPTLLLKSKIQCPRYAKKHVEMNNAIEDFIQRLVEYNSITEHFNDERITFFLQFFTDNTLEECDSLYISRLSLDNIELKRNSTDSFTIESKPVPPRNSGFENSGIEVIITKESSSGNYKRGMTVDRQRGNYKRDTAVERKRGNYKGDMMVDRQRGNYKGDMTVDRQRGNYKGDMTVYRQRGNYKGDMTVDSQRGNSNFNFYDNIKKLPENREDERIFLDLEKYKIN
jgi:hypothetical protein